MLSLSRNFILDTLRNIYRRCNDDSCYIWATELHNSHALSRHPLYGDNLNSDRKGITSPKCRNPLPRHKLRPSVLPLTPSQSGYLLHHVSRQKLTPRLDLLSQSSHLFLFDLDLLCPLAASTHLWALPVEDVHGEAHQERDAEEEKCRVLSPERLVHWPSVEGTKTGKQITRAGIISRVSIHGSCRTTYKPFPPVAEAAYFPPYAATM